MEYSVLMSVYFKEKPEYLKKALDSMLSQTEKPSQLVLVCDGKLTPELEKVIDTSQQLSILSFLELEAVKLPFLQICHFLIELIPLLLQLLDLLIGTLQDSLLS